LKHKIEKKINLKNLSKQKITIKKMVIKSNRKIMKDDGIKKVNFINHPNKNNNNQKN
jgi:hypothetical protein